DSVVDARSSAEPLVTPSPARAAAEQSRRRAVSRSTRLLSHRAALTSLVIGVVWGAFLPLAHAGLGDVLPFGTVTIDPLAACGGGPATSLALVQGSKIVPSAPTVPVVVATSCQTGDPATLHFVDPKTGLQMGFLPTTGMPATFTSWGALAVRG